MQRAVILVSTLGMNKKESNWRAAHIRSERESRECFDVASCHTWRATGWQQNILVSRDQTFLVDVFFFSLDIRNKLLVGPFFDFHNFRGERDLLLTPF